MSRRVNKQERAFRRSVAIEYMQSGKDRQEICLKYGLKSQATLSNWVKSTFPVQSQPFLSKSQPNPYEVNFFRKSVNYIRTGSQLNP